MGIGRRYILEVTEKIPSGATTVVRTIPYSMLDAFDGTRPNGTTFSYFTITAVDLQGLNQSQYESRVSDFLYYVNIDSTTEFNNLKALASFETGDCI